MSNDRLKENIQDTIDDLQEIAELFYQQSDKEAFEKFITTIDDIGVLIDCLNEYYEETGLIEFDKEKIYNILNDSMKAFQDDDKILMVDILQYDFSEYLESILSHMS